jgi:catechol 2,3-dioxygenase-like lactoylglutathione lyase family enzyme
VWRHGVAPADAARAHPAARPWKAALVTDGIPYTSFEVGNIEEEYARLSALGVRLTQPLTSLGGVTTAVLDDPCGNLMQIA